MALLDLDQRLLLFFNGLNNPFFDRFFWLYTGKVVYVWLPLALLLIVAFVKDKRREAVLIVLMLAISILLSDQLTHLLKYAICRLRPTHEPALMAYVHTVNHYNGGLYGFPSAHAANAFVIAIFSALIMRHPLYTATIYIFATLFAYSRIYLGVHYPFDVVVGAIVGTLIGVSMYYLYKALVHFLETHFGGKSLGKKEPSKKNARLTSTGMSRSSVYLFTTGYVVTLLFLVFFSI